MAKRCARWPGCEQEAGQKPTVVVRGADEFVAVAGGVIAVLSRSVGKGAAWPGMIKAAMSSTRRRDPDGRQARWPDAQVLFQLLTGHGRQLWRPRS